MEPWPFSEVEWQVVRDAARSRLNAPFEHDEVLRATCLRTLRETLNELRSRHGDHPVLWETEADFTDADEERLPLYARAILVSEAHDLQTLTIRISLAEALLRLSRPAEALIELVVCEGEMEESEDESDRKSWLDLRAECERLLPPIAHV